MGAAGSDFGRIENLNASGTFSAMTMNRRTALGGMLLCLAPMNVQAMEKPSGHTKGTPTGKATGPLKPGEYWWAPQASPAGPVVVLVSIPLQVMHVYRNGILIARSTVSTGSRGHSTPAGVFTILEKRKTHRSNKYNNAPMPHMQRLTWTGICMHSGQLPGYPASHGCIRLPYDFSKLLFALTEKGGTVVIGDSKKPHPHFAANPGLMLAPQDLTPEMLKPLQTNGYEWRPERSPEGPLAILVSGADRTMYVYRNGTPIGRAALTIAGSEPLGGAVFSMLEGESDQPSRWVPFRKARNWMIVSSTAKDPGTELSTMRRRIGLNPEFAEKLYALLTPGTSITVTDEPGIRQQIRDFAILSS
jgi:lipoprotein-anchoring transpeptidase ErfK/SrfK